MMEQCIGFLFLFFMVVKRNPRLFVPTIATRIFPVTSVLLVVMIIHTSEPNKDDNHCRIGSYALFVFVVCGSCSL
jgi:hypothetical protein